MSRLGSAASRFVRGLARALPTLLGVAVFGFFLLKLAPGDAVDVLAAETGGGNAATIAALRRQMGLDHSLGEQLLGYLGHLARLDLGYSLIYNMPVSSLIAERLPATVILMALSMVLALVLGVTAGVLLARYDGRLVARLVGGSIQLFYSVPAFCIGLLLIVIFSVRLGWLPIGDAETIGAELTGWRWLGDRAVHLILPVTTLSLFFLAVYARLVRAAMIDIAHQDYIRTALAKGLPARTVVWKHMLRNAVLPVVTIAGNHAGAMVSGAITLETVFNWPGMGRLAYEAVLKRDFTVVIGILLLSAVLVILANLLVDLLHGWIDPRIERA